MKNKVHQNMGHLRCIGDICPVCGRAFAVPEQDIIKCKEMGWQYPVVCERCRTGIKKWRGGVK